MFEFLQASLDSVTYSCLIYIGKHSNVKKESKVNIRQQYLAGI